MAKRPGKYAHVIHKLPRFPMVEAERATVVDAVKEAIKAPPNEADDPARDSELDYQRTVMLEAFKRIVAIETRATAGRPWASEYARVYAELRHIIDDLESMGNNLSVLLDAYVSLMVDAFEIEGVTGLKLTDGTPVNTYLEPYAQVVDPDAYRKWCIDNGLENKLKLPWPTTNSLTKQMLLDGLPEPDGVTCYAKTKIKLG